jgi:hypothetical protein
MQETVLGRVAKRIEEERNAYTVRCESERQRRERAGIYGKDKIFR